MYIPVHSVMLNTPFVDHLMLFLAEEVVIELTKKKYLPILYML